MEVTMESQLSKAITFIKPFLKGLPVKNVHFAEDIAEFCFESAYNYFRFFVETRSWNSRPFSLRFEDLETLKKSKIPSLDLPEIEDDFDYSSVRFESRPVYIKDNDLFLSQLKKVEHSMQKDVSRMDLCGVHCLVENQELTLETTNGHTLTRANSMGVDNDYLNGQVIPAEVVSALLKLADKNNGIVFCVGEDYSKVLFGSFSMIWQTIKSHFPNCEHLIPKENPLHFVVDKTACLTAIKQAKAFYKKKDIPAGIFSFSKDNLLIEIDENQNVKLPVHCRKIKGIEDDFLIGFNLSYIENALNNLNANEAVFELKEKMCPVMIKDLHSKNVIMPLRIKDK